MQFRLSLLLLHLALSIIVNASDRGDAEGAKLLQQAQQKSDLRELPTFRMKANLKIQVKGKSLDGSYTSLWNGPAQWREEISFPGYSEILIGVKDVVSVKRNLDFVPLQIHQIRSVLSYGRSDFQIRSDEKIAGVRDRKVNDINVRCVDLVQHVEQDHHRYICVDPSTGALIREHPFHDRELTPLGTKLFPRFLSTSEEGKIVAEAEITELTTPEQIPASAFDTPDGAISKPGCSRPSVGRLVQRVNPEYPSLDRMARREGTVSIYAVIGTDGELHKLHVVSGASPTMDQSSLDAVQHWRYEPFKCGDVPVEVETVIQVNYQLQH